MADILVAEDDQLTRLLLQQSLELDGYDVATVSNGYETLEYALSKKPKLVLLDLMMPGISGGEIIQQLREELADSIKIVVVTGTTNPENIEGVSEADLVMHKPIPIEDLLETVRKILK